MRCLGQLSCQFVVLGQLHETSTRQPQDDYKTTHKTIHKTTPFCGQACACVKAKKCYIVERWSFQGVSIHFVSGG